MKYFLLSALFLFSNLSFAMEKVNLAKEVELFWNQHKKIHDLMKTMGDLLPEQDYQDLNELLKKNNINNTTLMPKLIAKENKIFIGSQLLFEVKNDHIIVKGQKLTEISEDQNFAEALKNIQTTLDNTKTASLIDLLVPQAHAFFFGAFGLPLVAGLTLGAGFGPFIGMASGAILASALHRKWKKRRRMRRLKYNLFHPAPFSNF